MKPMMLAVLLLVLALPGMGRAAPAADLWPVWEANDPASSLRVDHMPWDNFLKKYVFPRFGTSLVNYKAVNAADLRNVSRYLERLAQTPVSRLNRKEQLAYWINFYNALTVKVVLDHYPVDSIRDIDISPGLFSNGPWGKKLVNVEGRELSLDDIEHRILRPIWRDPRLHYVLNCAAKGCPQIGREAFTAENTEKKLDAAAAAFVNHPHGVHFREGVLVVSSLYDWYGEDFGADESRIIAHLMAFARTGLREKLSRRTGIDDYHYDWALNALP